MRCRTIVALGSGHTGQVEMDHVKGGNADASTKHVVVVNAKITDRFGGADDFLD